MRAYLDSSAINHIYDRTGIDDQQASKIAEAVRTLNVQIPGSSVVAEELMRTAGKDRSRASALGTLYWGLMDRDHLIEGLPMLVVDSARAYARGDPDPSPSVVSSPATLMGWLDLAACRVAPGVIDEIVSETREDVTSEYQRMKILVPQGRAVAAAIRARGEPDTLTDVWRECSQFFIETWAKRAGVLDECRQRGIEGLLDRPPVLAAVGFEIAQLHAQVIKGERADPGDKYDFQHVVSAAAIAALFVTDDSTLRNRVNSIPRVVDVVSLTDFVARL